MAFDDLIAAEVTEVWSAKAVLGEGPTWDAAGGRVMWVDIKGRVLHAYGHRDGQRQSWSLPFQLCSLARPPPTWKRPPGVPADAFVGCGDGGLVWLGIDGGRVTALPLVDPERDCPANRFNDGKFGPDGRYWAGTMDDGERAASGRLYAFTPDGNYQTVDSGYRVTNGPTFSPDDRVLYHTDSALQEIYAFPLSAGGAVGPRRLLRAFGPGEGYPDGMTVDENGNLWVAMWDGHRLQRLRPDGRDNGFVQMPAARCTSCVFVEPAVLYVTSAAIGLEGQAGAGSLYRVCLG